MKSFLIFGLLCLGASLDGLAIPEADATEVEVDDESSATENAVPVVDEEEEETPDQYMKRHSGTSYYRPSYGGNNYYNRPSYGGSNYYNRPSYGGSNYNRPSYGGSNYYRPSYGGSNNYRPSIGFGNGILPSIGAGLAGAALGGLVGNTLSPTTGILGGLFGNGRSLDVESNVSESPADFESPFSNEVGTKGQKEAEEALNQYVKACNNYGRQPYYSSNYNYYRPTNSFGNIGNTGNFGNFGNLLNPFLGGAALGGALGLFGRSLDLEDAAAADPNGPVAPGAPVDPVDASLEKYLEICATYGITPVASRPANIDNLASYGTGGYSYPSYASGDYNNPSYTNAGFNNPSFTNDGYNNPSYTPGEYNIPSYTNIGSNNPSYIPSGYNIPSYTNVGYNNPLNANVGNNNPLNANVGYNYPGYTGYTGEYLGGYGRK